jgi:hypothetical protein
MSEKEDLPSCVKTKESGKKKSFLKSLSRYGLLRVESKRNKKGGKVGLFIEKGTGLARLG